MVGGSLLTLFGILSIGYSVPLGFTKEEKINAYSLGHVYIYYCIDALDFARLQALRHVSSQVLFNGILLKHKKKS